MAEKFHWLRSIPGILGTLVGIVLTAIGGVMTLNVVLKVYVFGFTSDSYFNPAQECQYDFEKPLKEGEERVKLSGAEKADCIAEKTVYNEKRYLQQKKENMIDGVAMLLIGIPFWVIFARRKKQPSTN